MGPYPLLVNAAILTLYVAYVCRSVKVSLLEDAGSCFFL